MRPAKKMAASIIGVVVLLILLTPIVYVQVNKIIYAHRVSAYLMDNKGYKKEDIASVTGVWGIKAPPFFAVVEFSDEPGVEYTYFAHNDVLQFSHSITSDGWEQGFRESKLKHVEAD